MFIEDLFDFQISKRGINKNWSPTVLASVPALHRCQYFQLSVSHFSLPAPPLYFYHCYEAAVSFSSYACFA